MIDLLAFAFLNLLGVMSPGPDFAIVTRYGLTGSRRAALLASFGVGAALLIHVFYCVSGVALFLHSSPKILGSIRVLGALYLGYLGLRILFEKSTQDQGGGEVVRHAFVAGFVSNILNPKAMVFLLSLFSQFAHSMNTLSMKFAYALSIPLIATVWFSILSCFMTHPYFLPFMQRSGRKFMIAMSVVLLFLSVSGIISGIQLYN